MSTALWDADIGERPRGEKRVRSHNAVRFSLGRREGLLPTSAVTPPVYDRRKDIRNRRHSATPVPVELRCPRCLCADILREIKNKKKKQKKKKKKKKKPVIHPDNRPAPEETTRRSARRRVSKTRLTDRHRRGIRARSFAVVMLQMEMVIFLCLVLLTCVYSQEPSSKVVADRFAVFWNRTNAK
ncbi:Ephrin-A5b [Liparis tanakae]|uniref:Ephrin-A5b n=1 Tax=Liparis tanakae TaxID=230148 RepID=A0A4Z2FRD2_9TELE|nr:Ephrin-A5b [Liparis tanakae]